MEKRWPPERVKSFEAPRLFIACATRRPPWTAPDSAPLAVSRACSVAIEPRLPARSRPGRGAQRGRRARRRGRTSRPPRPSRGRPPASPARAPASSRPPRACARPPCAASPAAWRARRSAASRSPFLPPRAGALGVAAPTSPIPEARCSRVSRPCSIASATSGSLVAAWSVSPTRSRIWEPTPCSRPIASAVPTRESIASRSLAPAWRSLSRSAEPESISSCAARSSSPTFSSRRTSLAFRTDSWLTSQAARLGFFRPFTQSAASASPSERSDFASSLRAGVNSSSGPWKSSSSFFSGTPLGGLISVSATQPQDLPNCGVTGRPPTGR